MANAREQLGAVADWLGDNDETLSAGLRNPFDALRLYDYAMAHPNLPEMADEWTPAQFKRAIGYDPMLGENHESETTGADAAGKALVQARNLLSSVAFVAKNGDTKAVLKKIGKVVV